MGTLILGRKWRLLEMEAILDKHKSLLSSIYIYINIKHSDLFQSTPTVNSMSNVWVNILEQISLPRCVILLVVESEKNCKVKVTFWLNLNKIPTKNIVPLSLPSGPLYKSWDLPNLCLLPFWGFTGVLLEELTSSAVPLCTCVVGQVLWFP